MTTLSQAVNTPNIVEKSFLTSDHVKLTYLDSGSGNKTLIFIPGWLMPAEIFNAQLQFFSKNYRVIALNPRSQGSSDIYLGTDLAQRRTQDIKELISHTQSEKFVLIGWSLGVMESLDYLHRYGQEGLEALVLVDNSIGEGTPPVAKKTTNKSKSPMTSDKFIKYVKGFVRAIFKNEPPKEILQSTEQSALRLSKQPNQAFRVLSKPFPREYYRDTVYDIKVPIWYAITPRYTEQGLIFSEKHPLGTSTIYDNAGHALFVDVADEFNRDLENFLRNDR